MCVRKALVIANLQHRAVVLYAFEHVRGVLGRLGNTRRQWFYTVNGFEMLYCRIEEMESVVRDNEAGDTVCGGLGVRDWIRR